MRIQKVGHAATPGCRHSAPRCLPVCLPTCLPVCLPICLPTCLPECCSSVRCSWPRRARWPWAAVAGWIAIVRSQQPHTHSRPAPPRPAGLLRVLPSLCRPRFPLPCVCPLLRVPSLLRVLLVLLVLASRAACSCAGWRVCRGRACAGRVGGVARHRGHPCQALRRDRHPRGRQVRARTHRRLYSHRLRRPLEGLSRACSHPTHHTHAHTPTSAAGSA